ncbi:MAG: preprotein translocase subunit SecG [Candidatus Riflebacteria bacterium]|nr:preprotein translocase subunit SecG [Candidatus Riflebacteria bacterium]
MIAILIKFVHFLVCIGLIVIVLLQADKGEGLAGAFGGGASNTMFGERGSTTPIAKFTTGMAVIFMITSLVLAVFVPKMDGTMSASGNYRTQPPMEAPVQPPSGK